jgi:hypothetical protein
MVRQNRGYAPPSNEIAQVARARINGQFGIPV